MGAGGDEAQQRCRKQAQGVTHPSPSGGRSERNVRRFCRRLSTPRTLFVEEFLEDFPPGCGDPDGPGDVLPQVWIDHSHRVLAGPAEHQLVHWPELVRLGALLMDGPGADELELL